MAVATRMGATAGRAIRPSRKLSGADVASRTDTATANLTAFNVEDAISIDAQLNVTAAGTTMTVKLQTTLDGTNWYDVGTFAAQTTTTSQQMTFGGNIGVQARWAISAITGSFTWSIDTQSRGTL